MATVSADASAGASVSASPAGEQLVASFPSFGIPPAKAAGDAAAAAKAVPFGGLLGVGPHGVPAFSNEDETNLSGDRYYPAAAAPGGAPVAGCRNPASGAGAATGFKWQAVEYVRRFLLSSSGVRLPETPTAAGLWQVDAAAAVDPPHGPVPLQRYENGSTLTLPAVGDVLVWGRGPRLPFGHVAVVAEVCEGSRTVSVAEQNSAFAPWVAPPPLSGAPVSPHGKGPRAAPKAAVPSAGGGTAAADDPAAALEQEDFEIQTAGSAPRFPGFPAGRLTAAQHAPAGAPAGALTIGGPAARPYSTAAGRQLQLVCVCGRFEVADPAGETVLGWMRVARGAAPAADPALLDIVDRFRPALAAGRVLRVPLLRDLSLPWLSAENFDFFLRRSLVGRDAASPSAGSPPLAVEPEEVPSGYYAVDHDLWLRAGWASADLHRLFVAVTRALVLAATEPLPGDDPALDAIPFAELSVEALAARQQQQRTAAAAAAEAAPPAGEEHEAAALSVLRGAKHLPSSAFAAKALLDAAAGELVDAPRRLAVAELPPAVAATALVEQFCVPRPLHPLLRRSLGTPPFLGRFDFGLDARCGALKAMEYNSDSSAALLEAAVTQQQVAGHYGFDAVGGPAGDRLMPLMEQHWRQLRASGRVKGGVVHFMVDDDDEEWYTALAVMKAAQAAGFECQLCVKLVDFKFASPEAAASLAGGAAHDVARLQGQPNEPGAIPHRVVVDLKDRPVELVWKTWAWPTVISEWEARRDASAPSTPHLPPTGTPPEPAVGPTLSDILLHPTVVVLEPMWKAVAGSKALLPYAFQHSLRQRPVARPAAGPGAAAFLALSASASAELDAADSDAAGDSPDREAAQRGGGGSDAAEDPWAEWRLEHPTFDVAVEASGGRKKHRKVTPDAAAGIRRCHPNLLPASFALDDKVLGSVTDYVEKPVRGRGGQNVRLVAADDGAAAGGDGMSPAPMGTPLGTGADGGHGTPMSTGGRFAEDLSVFQDRMRLAQFAGYYPIFCGWVVGDDFGGLCTREDKSKITTLASCVAPIRVVREDQ